jgi:hypothetical protein
MCEIGNFNLDLACSNYYVVMYVVLVLFPFSTVVCTALYRNGNSAYVVLCHASYDINSL